METVTGYFYLVKDGFGQQCYAVAEEPSTTIQIQGVQNAGEEDLYFESDAYHLEEWCRMNGLEYKQVTMNFNFEDLWNGKTIKSTPKD